jgi:luciferase family oxidoreductase group 1
MVGKMSNRTKGIELSVLDQSPRSHGKTLGEAFSETVKLAQIAEQLGFKRFWVAEHHNSRSFAGTSPELLIQAIACKTKSIRVGSGGIMLPNASPLKVSELFSVLNAFHPGRIDLGIGRATGGDSSTAKALGSVGKTADFGENVAEILNLLWGKDSAKHPGIKAYYGPRPASPPQVWMLGSGRTSADIAARLGLPFVFADFIGRSRDIGPTIVRHYIENFVPSETMKQPKASVALDVICADTRQEAERFGLTGKYITVDDRYNFDGLQPHDLLSTFVIDQPGAEVMRNGAYGQIAGAPDQIKETISHLSEVYAVREFFILTNCYYFNDRVRSYELLASAFDLPAHQYRV